MPSSTIVESNRQVLKAATEKERRRGEHDKITSRDKATIAKYVSEHGVAKVVRCFNPLTGAGARFRHPRSRPFNTT